MPRPDSRAPNDLSLDVDARRPSEGPGQQAVRAVQRHRSTRRRCAGSNVTFYWRVVAKDAAAAAAGRKPRTRRRTTKKGGTPEYRVRGSEHDRAAVGPDRSDAHQPLVHRGARATTTCSSSRRNRRQRKRRRMRRRRRSRFIKQTVDRARPVERRAEHEHGDRGRAYRSAAGAADAAAAGRASVRARHHGNRAGVVDTSSRRKPSCRRSS